MNSTCEYINEELFKKYHPDNKYYIGQQLICRKTFNTKKYRTYLNYSYTVMDIKTDTFVINDGDTEFEIEKSHIYNHFRLPYSRTCHSYQGLSEDEPITIFDIGEFFVDMDWIYTAITRTTALENINIFTGVIPKIIKFDLKTQIGKMINQHLDNDIKANREIIGEYVDVEWVMDKLKKVKTCKYCKKQLDYSSVECFSIDRINNAVCHNQSNSQIICRICNVSKK